MPISVPPQVLSNVDMTSLDRFLTIFNTSNSANFQASDVSLGVPQAISDSAYNTLIRVYLNSANYSGSMDFYYNRTNVADVLDDSQVITQGTATKLSDLINQINSTYSLSLTSSDYEEQTITAYDPTLPYQRASVSVTANPASILFCGSVVLYLGEKITATTASTALSYIVTDSSVYAYKDKTPVAAFDAFSNVSNIQHIGITDFFVKPNGHLILNGSFSFTVTLQGQAAQSVVASRLEMDVNGTVLSVNAIQAFGGTDAAVMARNKNQANSFVVAKPGAIGTNSLNNLYRFDVDGNLDAAFHSTGLSYTPAYVGLNDAGLIYTASPVFTAPVATNSNIAGQQIRIDRLLASGDVDPTWVSVVVTAPGLNAPPAVAQIVDDGVAVWVVFSPALADCQVAPIINGAQTAVYEGETFAYNPVVQFDLYGNLNTKFATAIPQATPDSILIADSTNPIAAGDSVLSVKTDSVVLFTNARNPVTGFAHRQPIAFSKIYGGNRALFPIASYITSPRWVSARNIAVQSDGTFLVGGSAKLAAGNNSWTIPTAVVAKYNADGTFAYLITTLPGTTNQTPNIVKVLSYQS
jgi:hypothetical protein